MASLPHSTDTPITPEVDVRLMSGSARAFLAAVIESSDDAIITKSLDGIITSWNKSAQRLFGYTDEEAIGQPITMLIPADRLGEEPGILERLRRGERVEHFETVRMRQDGSLLDVSLTISPVRDESGKIIGISKIARDITERMRAQEALRDADRRKDEFLAMLAHELRNPLAPIRNTIEILRRTSGDARTVRAAAETLDRQVGHMVRLVDDLLDVNRISRGKIKLHKERVNLVSVLYQAVESIAPLCETMGHELTVSLPPNPVFLQGEPTRLAQVVGNLLNNACKFTDPGGRIWLIVEQVRDQVIIRVRDTGIGLKPDQFRRIFEMFTQVDNSIERSRGGLGLGLLLVKSMVELHGGTVEVHSAGLGKGSEFVVTLPILVEAVAPDEDGSSDDKTTATVAQRILVVDDNRDAADSLTMLLRLIGHEAHTAYDGQEALEVAAQHRFDAILLDIGLPKVNGYETARRIREEQRNDKVMLVALTGWGQTENRRLSQEAGFNVHMVKPVDFAELTRLLSQANGS